MTQYLTEIENEYKKHEHFLTELPELKQHDEINLNALNTWLRKNQQLHLMLDVLVFNVLPGVLSAGLFHLFYYAYEAIISFVNTVIFKENVTFHSNWTDHLSIFKKSKKTLSKIKKIEEKIKDEINPTYLYSQSTDQSDTSNKSNENNFSTSEEFIESAVKNEPTNYLEEMLPVELYPSLFQFLSLEALAKLAQTSNNNKELIHDYFLHFNYDHIVSLPKSLKLLEQLLQYAIDKSYNNLFIAIIQQCQEPDLSKYLHPFLIKATQENNIEPIKKILSLKNPITDQAFFDVNTVIFPISEFKFITTESIFVLASKHGNPTLMRLCLKHGAQRLRSGRTQLGYAIRSKNLECVEIMLGLISTTYDIEVFLNLSRLHGLFAYEYNALTETVDFGTVEIAQLLINHGADVNQDNERGCPMVRALNTHNLDMFILLLSNNYDLRKHEDFLLFMIDNLKYTRYTSMLDQYKLIAKIMSSKAYKERENQNSDIKEFLETPESIKALEPDYDKLACIEWCNNFLKITKNNDNSNIIAVRKLLLEPVQETIQEETARINSP